MDIRQCLLDINNRREILGRSIADRVAARQKVSLWSDRCSAVDTIVIHYMSAVNVHPDNPFDEPTVLSLFTEYGVSSHYMIDRGGTVTMLVPEDKKAWHCGGSIMPPPDLRRDVNEFSIGIELVATPDSGYTDAQYAALVELCLDIQQRHAAVSFTYVGHEEIAGTRAVALLLREEPKTDPGRLFDWARFRAMLRAGDSTE